MTTESPETVSMSALAYNLLFRGVDIAILSEGEEDINLLPSELIPIDEIKIPPLIKFSRKAACQCLSEVSKDYKVYFEAFGQESIMLQYSGIM